MTSDHPLRRRAIENVLDDAPQFYGRCEGLAEEVHLDVFRRGVHSAWDPGNINGIPGLTTAERNALRTESEPGLIQQTKDLKVTILITACAAITQGWQQSSINASSLYWKDELPGQKDDFWKHHPILAGLIDAAPWLSASIIGTWLSDPLQEGRLGRRWALFISAVFCTAFVLGTARCNTWVQLLICRLLLGIGIGAKASVAPVFAAETAIKNLRGRLLMMWQLFDTLGIFIGFACVWIVDMHWRVLLGSAAIPSLILLFLVFLCPESPRFLIRKKKYSKAFVSLRHLRGSDIQASRDLYEIHSNLQFEAQQRLRQQGIRGIEWFEGELYQDEIKTMNFFKRVRALWSIKRNRSACLAAFIVMASQQLCGINVLAFYSSSIFVGATKDSQGNYPVKFSDLGGNPRRVATKVAWLNFGFGLANFLFTLPAYRFIDGRNGKGRRLLLLVSLGGMFFTLVAISSFFLIHDDGIRLGLVSSFTIGIFLVFYGIGAGPVPFTFSAEVFPLAFREVGMSFSVMVNFLGLGLLVLFVPVITHSFETNGEAYLLYIFTGLDALAFVLVFLFVPSGTAQVDLENMNEIFDKEISDLVKENLVGGKAGDGQDREMGAM